MKALGLSALVLALGIIAIWVLRRPPQSAPPVTTCPSCGGLFAWGRRFRMWLPVCLECEGVWLHAEMPAVQRRGTGISHFAGFKETPCKICPHCREATLETGHIGVANALGCRRCGGTFRPGPAGQVPIAGI